jgi:hypothetical protein
MSQSPLASTVRLPNVHAIGFTGDVHLGDEAMCRGAIDRFLRHKQAVVGRTVYGVSSIAAGASAVFAESCIGLGVPLRVLLPVPRDLLLKGCSSKERERFEHLIESALSVETITGEDSADEQHYECGLQIVQQCQELLAVWDGQRPQDMSGPGDIVEFAKQIGRPISWIHRETGVLQELQRQSEQRPIYERELDFLNQLPSVGTAADAADGPRGIAESWLAKLDANATELAPEVRRLAALPIVFTALAAFVSAQEGKQSAIISAGVWSAAGATLGTTAAVLPAVLRLAKRQALWVRVRTAAEVTRSVLALWDTPDRYKVVGQEILPELSGMVRTLDLLKAQAGREGRVKLGDFRERYVEARLLDQKRYFSKQSELSAEMGRRYRLFSKVCTVSAILLSAWMFGSRTLMKLSYEVSGGAWLSMVSSALFQLATVAGALLVVNECERRERRYQEIHRSLADWEVELRAFRTWPPVIEVVDKIERALLVELLEWRSLLQNMKMPRN